LEDEDQKAFKEAIGAELIIKSDLAPLNANHVLAERGAFPLQLAARLNVEFRRVFEEFHTKQDAESIAQHRRRF